MMEIETFPTMEAYQDNYISDIKGRTKSDTCIIDQSTVYYFKHLIKKYKKQMGDIDNTNVCSGGLQQYLNKQSEKNEQQKLERSQGGQQQSKFECLPVDVKLHIFSYLSATELCRASRICRSWYDITEDNLLWQNLLERDIKRWDIIGHNTNPAIYKEVESEWPNKEIYLRCSPEINRMMHQQNSIFSNISNMLRYFLPKKTPMFAMFGPGLEGKTSIIVRQMMETTNNSAFQTTGMFPGKFGGVGGGFTLKTQSSQFHLSVLYSAPKQEREKPGRDRSQKHRLMKENKNVDIPDKYELVPHVQDFCRTLDGFVYVIDATADSPEIECGFNELIAMISERWSATHIPVLVLSTVRHRDCPRVSCCDVIDKLQLSTLNRPWQVRSCVADTLDGVVDGFTWLSEQTQRR